MLRQFPGGSPAIAKQVQGEGVEAIGFHIAPFLDLDFVVGEPFSLYYSWIFPFVQYFGFQ